MICNYITLSLPLCIIRTFTTDTITFKYFYLSYIVNAKHLPALLLCAILTALFYQRFNNAPLQVDQIYLNKCSKLKWMSTDVKSKHALIFA